MTITNRQPFQCSSKNELAPLSTSYPVFRPCAVNPQSWSNLPIDITPDLDWLGGHFTTFDLTTPVNHNDIIFHLDSDSTVTGGFSIAIFVESSHLQIKIKDFHWSCLITSLLNEWTQSFFISITLTVWIKNNTSQITKLFLVA